VVQWYGPNLQPAITNYIQEHITGVHNLFEKFEFENPRDVMKTENAELSEG